MFDIEGSDIDRNALARYIDEQIYTLPGTERHREEFSVVLTGSRAFGMHTPSSDVDLDVFCPRSVYESVHEASVKTGIVESPTSFFVILQGDDWHRYHGEDKGRPHYTLLALEDVEQRLREYDDVAMWIWSNARIITDPEGRFARMRDAYRDYPRDVLIRKLKYRWLLAWYWAIEVYPHHHESDDEFLPAASALLNTINELLRFFHLAEGRPFPYAERLMTQAHTTELGRQFGPMLKRTIDLVVGKEDAHLSAWERLDKAFKLCVCNNDIDPDPLEEAGYKVLLDAGADPKWVAADFNNIDELLLGQLGPPP